MFETNKDASYYTVLPYYPPPPLCPYLRLPVLCDLG